MPWNVLDGNVRNVKTPSYLNEQKVSIPISRRDKKRLDESSDTWNTYNEIVKDYLNQGIDDDSAIYYKTASRLQGRTMVSKCHLTLHTLFFLASTTLLPLEMGNSLRCDVIGGVRKP